MQTCNLHHDKLNIQDLGCQHMSCKNVNVAEKEYEKCVSSPKVDLRFGYSQLFYHKGSQFIVTTPVMVCPFGISNYNNNFKICLQFSNYMEDPVMKSFYDFIQRCEYKQMELLGLDEDESDLFLSQIKHHKQGKYDPNLEVKLPFNYNRFQCDIYSDDYSSISIMNIPKFSKLQCDIYLDRIWKYNENYVSKWKVKMIHLL